VALAPMVKDGSVDLVCATRVKGLSGEFIRFEPMVWAATPSAQAIWKERPLPIAVFLPGSVARENAIRSLERAKIPYRTSYESPSLMGLLSMVEAGLAVAPLARCAVPAHFSLLGQAQGLPEIDPLEVILARSSKSKRPPCDFLAEKIMSELRR
jgi:DNA-binding transcriptional LysR family regulator